MGSMPPNREQIKNKISEITRIPLQKIQGDSLLTDLVQESFVLIEMIIELQEAFRFRVSQEDLIEVKTLDDLLNLIEKKLS